MLKEKLYELITDSKKTNLRFNKGNNINWDCWFPLY